MTNLANVGRRILVGGLLLFSVWTSYGEAAEKHWETIMSDREVNNIAALGGNVYAATDQGLFVKLHNDEGDAQHVDYFGNLPISKVWVTPIDQRRLPVNIAGDDAYLSAVLDRAVDLVKHESAAYVISEGRLYTNNHSNTTTWKLVFDETHEFANRTVLDIHGNHNQIALLLEHDNPQKARSSDAMVKDTTRGEVYLGKGDNPFHPTPKTAIGSFAATQVFVDTAGNIYTYGDMHGANGATIGVTTDGGESWIHAVPQDAGKNGEIAATPDVLVVTSSIGNLAVSKDKGQSFQLVTKWKGLPSAVYSAAVVVGKLLFVGTKGQGVYVSLDNGDTFRFHATVKNKRNFPSDNVSCLAFDHVTWGLYAGTDKGVTMKRRAIENEGLHTEPLNWFSFLFSPPKFTF